jgi:glycosyltransferase involved in cell wall biosynthesis
MPGWPQVVFIVSGDLWGGAESMAVSLAAALHRQGLPLRALTFNEGLTAQRLQEEGVPTQVVNERQAFPVMVARTWRLLRGGPVGIIHAHGYKENLLAAALAPLLGWPRLVSTMHGLSELAAGQQASLKHRLASRLNLSLLARCFTTVAVSEAVRASLAEYHGLPASRLETICNGIPIPEDVNGQPADRPPRIGSAGRLYPVKNFSLLIEVAARVCARRPEVKFQLLGDGPQRASLEGLIQDKGLQGSVELLGFRSDPAPFYESCTLYLNTSRHEGMPLAALEAMAHGVPVVAPRVGGFPEIIEEGREGLLTTRLDADELAECCLKLLDDEPLRQKMGQAAREKVISHFSIAAMARGYTSLYQDVAGGEVLA